MNDQLLQGTRLSPLQKRVWSLQNESPVYFLQCEVDINGSLDENKLSDSIRTVISRHEILRTVYHRQAGLAFPLQVANENHSFTWQEAGNNGFNYENEPPLQATLTQKDENSWQLLLKMPALAADSFSMQMLVEEIVAEYDGTVPGNDILQYTRFSEWQHELLASPDEFAADFWSKYSFQKGNEYAIPFLNYNTTGGPFSPQQIVISPAAKLLGSLEYTAAVNRINVADIILGCFSMVIQRFIGNGPLTIGYTGKGREYDELEHTLGLLEKTLPLMIPAGYDGTFTGLVQQIAEEKEKVKEYGEYFNPLSGAEEQDYFRSVFQEEEIKEITTASDVKFCLQSIQGATDKFDVKLIYIRRKDRAELRFCFDNARLNELSATTMAAQLTALLEEVVKTPRETVREISERSIRQAAFPGDVTAAVVPGNNIIEVFDYIVQQNNDTVAVQAGGSLLTYGQLKEKAEQLSAYLVKQCGIKKGDIVALCMPRSEDMITAMFGILKSGAAYLPIDPKTPAARINYMLEDSKSALLITDRDVLSPDISAEVISLGPAFWEKLHITTALQPSCCGNCQKNCGKHREGEIEQAAKKEGIDPGSISYIIYTSGSTGKPKGVLITHGSLLNYAHWFITKYDIGAADRTLLFSSVAFDLCYTALWPSLLSGATLVIHEETEYLDPLAFTNDLVENKISFIKLTPSHFSLIARDPLFNVKFDKYSLRLIVLGGEEIVAEDVEEYLRYNPGVQFVNHYGPTETTIGVLTKNISKENIAQFRKKTVLGRPNTGNQVFIIDENAKRECAIGETGEICVSGRGLAAGYLNRKELTDEKFTANPLLDETLMYRTGDLGRRMPDGDIEFLGRKDFQVKIRGYRIETGEIEEALLSFPGAEDASVLVTQPEETAEKQLVAFVKSKEKLKSNLLIDHIAGRLPHYMMPVSIKVLPSFPLLPNGKLDRKALLELAGRETNIKEYIAPRNNTERMLASIWKEVLSSRQPGINDNFFELGGHSLKAAQLVSRIYKAFDRKIELRAVFDHPTIGQLAKVIQATGFDQYDPIPKVQEAAYYPVSHAQKRLWILNQFTKDKIPYNSSSCYRIRGELDIAKLQSAFDALIERHESLRTSFINVDGTPRQKINTVEACGFKLIVDDVQEENDPDRVIEQLTLYSYHTPFDLEKGPLLRARVIRVREREYLLVCNIHHIIYDGWSLSILFNELLTIYNAYTENIENPLPPLTVQYKDYSVWHNAKISPDEEEYWLQKLSNHPRLISLPYDKVENPDEINYSRRDVYFSEEDTNALREIAKNCQTTLSNLLLGIYGLFLNQVSGQQDIMIGIGHANRNHEDTEKLIGFFINMLAIRIRFSEEDTLESVVKQVSENAIEAFQHSNYPFDLLVEKLCVNRYADRQPILNVMYDFKNFYDIQLQEDFSLLETNLQIEQVKMGETLAAHDLILHVVDNGGNIMYYFEYKKECFLPSTVHNFYTVFKKLAGLVAKELLPITEAAC